MATQTRLETLLEKMKKFDQEKAKLEGEIAVVKAMDAFGDTLATRITTEAVKAKVDIKVLHGKFLALRVGEDGKLTVEIATKASNGNGKQHTSGTGADGNHVGNGNGHTYVLKDGRPFSRLVDAVEALQGKPCTLKHDGKTYEDGKPILRYERLTNALKADITAVAKPAPATPEPAPATT